MARFMTVPMSFMPFAPVSLTALSTIASSSSCERGREGTADDLGFGRLGCRPLLSSGFAERFCRLVALLELAPEDGLLFLLGERPPRLYLGVLERGAEHTQGADAGPVALLHGGLGVALYGSLTVTAFPASCRP